MSAPTIEQLVERTMTKTRALEIARDAVYMHRLGDGWIVSVYDADVDAMREYGPMAYDVARVWVTEARVRVALAELGHTAGRARYPEDLYTEHDYSLAVIRAIEGPGSVRERVRKALEVI